MKNLLEAMSNVHKTMLEWRAFDTLLTTDRFEAAIKASTGEHLDDLEVILKSGRTERLKRWIKDRLAGPLKFRPYRQLRELAKRENVPRWSRLDRDELIAALTAKGKQ